MNLKKVRISIIGLGSVGLPLALAFAREVPNVMGFDVNGSKIEELRKGFDRTGEADPVALKSSSLIFTSDPADLQNTDVFIIAVPKPIDRAHRPDLSFLLQASELVGKVMKPGTVVCFESTVYPGVTEDICGPALAATSGMKQGKDFFLGYSPERINPGDKAYRSYLEAGVEELSKRFKPEGGVFVDVKSQFAPDEFDNRIMYWSL